MQEPYSQSQYEDPTHHDQANLSATEETESLLTRVQREAVKVLDETGATPAELSEHLKEALTLLYLVTSPLNSKDARLSARKTAVERLEGLMYVAKGIL